MTGCTGAARSTAKLVLMCMSAASETFFFGSLDTLATDACINRKTVFKAIQALEYGQLIKPTGTRRGRTKQIIEYKFCTALSTYSPKNGTVPEMEPFRFYPETVPFLPGKSTKNGIRILEGKEKGKKDTRARAFMGAKQALGVH